MVETACLLWLKITMCWIDTNKIWDKIKEKLNIKFHRKPVYGETYIKVQVREFDDKMKTNFLGDGVPKENRHYTCIACIAIDSVIKTDKKNYPQVYLEECKYRVKKCRCLDLSTLNQNQIQSQIRKQGQNLKLN